MFQLRLGLIEPQEVSGVTIQQHCLLKLRFVVSAAHGILLVVLISNISVARRKVWCGIVPLRREVIGAVAVDFLFGGEGMDW